MTHSTSPIRILLIAIAIAWTLPTRPALASAIISNGVIQLGVNDEGHLNVPGGAPTDEGGSDVGVRYLPTGSDSTAEGCACEGWGVADLLSGTTGFGNVEIDGVHNLQVLSFVADAERAVSTVQIKDWTGSPLIRVTHAFAPSPQSANVYVVTVRIENIGTTTIQPAYRRVAHWGVEPVIRSTYSTIETGSASNIVFTSDDGFASANPLVGPSARRRTGSFIDEGPDYEGALFDLQFEALAPGAAQEFTLFYGAAGSQRAALAALETVRAEAYSYGQPMTDAHGIPEFYETPRTDLGLPNTFFLAFSGIGGTPVNEVGSITLAPPERTLRINQHTCIGGTVLDPFGRPYAGARISFSRGGANEGSEQQISDANGAVNLCWTGAKSGRDYIRASNRDLFATATVDWLARELTDLVAAPALSLNLARNDGRRPLAPQARLTTRSNGVPIVGKTLVFEAENQPLCTATTDASGTARCSGFLRAPGSLIPVLRDSGYAVHFAGDQDYVGADAQGKLLLP